MEKGNFDTCEHNWHLSVDSDDSGGPINKPWKSFFQCTLCSHSITLEEKCSLDGIKLQKESNQKQERSLQIAMWAMIIGAITTVIATFI